MKVEKKPKRPVEYETVITLSDEEKALLKHIVRSGIVAIREKAKTYYPPTAGMTVALLLDDPIAEYGNPSAPLNCAQATFASDRGGYGDSPNVRSILRGLDIYE